MYCNFFLIDDILLLDTSVPKSKDLLVNHDILKLMKKKYKKLINS